MVHHCYFNCVSAAQKIQWPMSTTWQFNLLATSLFQTTLPFCSHHSPSALCLFVKPLEKRWSFRATCALTPVCEHHVGRLLSLNPLWFPSEEKEGRLLAPQQLGRLCEQEENSSLPWLQQISRYPKQPPGHHVGLWGRTWENAGTSKTLVLPERQNAIL